MHDDLIWTFFREALSTSTADFLAEPGLAERFALVRRISDALAHELKNPLNAMVINLELLRTRVRAGRVTEALERVDVLEHEARRLHLLLDQVLRLVRPEPLGEGTYALEPLLADVGNIADVLAKLARQHFELCPVSEALVVVGRRDPLRCALLWLAEGAIAALPADSGPLLLQVAEGPTEVQLTLEAPIAAAAGLQAALPSAAKLLSEDGIPVALALDEAVCRVRIPLPRAGG